ncbi:MAG: hypothetical protein WC043_05120 [Pseudobdellovibrionaceae bacterium]
MFGLLARASPYVGKLLGFFKSGIGLTAVGAGTAVVVDKATEKKGADGQMVKPGIVTQGVDAVTGIAGRGVRTFEEKANDANAQLKAQETMMQGDLAAQQAAASKTTEVEAQAKLLRMQAQKEALEGTIDKTNFWTGMMGSIIADIVNAVAPGSGLSQWVNKQVTQAKTDQDRVKSMIDYEGPVSTPKTDMPTTSVLARTVYTDPNKPEGDLRSSFKPAALTTTPAPTARQAAPVASAAASAAAMLLHPAPEGTLSK